MAPEQQPTLDATSGGAPHVPSDLAAWLYGTQAETAATNRDADLCKRSLDLGRARLAQARSSGECPYVVLNELHFERWARSLSWSGKTVQTS